MKSPYVDFFDSHLLLFYFLVSFVFFFILLRTPPFLKFNVIILPDLDLKLSFSRGNM